MLNLSSSQGPLCHWKVYVLCLPLGTECPIATLMQLVTWYVSFQGGTGWCQLTEESPDVALIPLWHRAGREHLCACGSECRVL